MTKSKKGPSSIYVGVFESSESVPKTYQGTHIYYSPELYQFAILDKNGKTLQFFDFEKFHQFDSVNVISFDGNIKSFIDDAYQEWANKQTNQLSNIINQHNTNNDNNINDPQDNNTNIIQEEIPVDELIDDIPYDIATAPEESIDKDPSKHLGAWFSTIIIITIMIVLIILLGPILFPGAAQLFS